MENLSFGQRQENSGDFICDQAKSGLDHRPLSLILWTFVSLLGLQGCESKVEIRTTSAPTESRRGGPKGPGTGGDDPTGTLPPGGGGTGRAEAINLPGALSANRDYFQTRSVINLTVTPDEVQPGDLFSLFNVSTNEELVEPRPLGLGSSDTTSEPFSLGTSGVKVYLSLFPIDPRISQKLTYGANLLRLEIDSGTPKKSEKTVYLRDFKLLGVQASRFGENRQTIGGFQGEVSTLRRPAMQAGSHILTNGFLMMVNQ